MSDLTKPHKEQRHELHAFLSSRFNRTQLGWAILEKEAYAVLGTLDSTQWVLDTTDGSNLYTDHNNMISIFDPLSVFLNPSQTPLRKSLRWPGKLRIYAYNCFHVKRKDNVWADLLGRRSATPATVRRLIRIPELP